MGTVNVYVRFKTSASEGTDARLILRNASYPENHRGFDAVISGGTAGFEVNGLSVGAEYVWTLVTCADSGAVQFEEHGRISVYRKSCACGNDFGGASITGDLTTCQVLYFSVR